MLDLEGLTSSKKVEDKRFRLNNTGSSEGCYYHVFNRGVDKRVVFMDTFDFMRFEETLSYYLKGPHSVSLQLHKDKGLLDLQGLTNRVNIISYCLMKNHFHLLLRGLTFDGIAKYMSDVSNSYTRYFNAKYHRNGVLFQGRYKRKTVETEASILQVSRYIHLNPGQPYLYPFSSLNVWIDIKNFRSKIVNLRDLQYWVQSANGSAEYKSFVDSKINSDKEAGIEDLIFEDS